MLKTSHSEYYTNDGCDQDGKMYEDMNWYVNVEWKNCM